MKLIPYVAMSYALHFAAKHCLKRYEKRTEQDRGELHILSAGFKAWSTEICNVVLNICREATGGLGYSQLNRLGELRDNQDITKTFEGDNVVLYQQVAKELLEEFARQFNSNGGMLMKISGFLSYVWNYMLINENVNKNAVRYKTSGWFASPQGVQDAEVYKFLLEYRAARLIETAASRVNHYRNKFTKPSTGNKQQDKNNKIETLFQAWNTCQCHLVDAARAHVEYELVKIFLQTIENARQEFKDQQEKQKAEASDAAASISPSITQKEIDILQKLCDLVALTLVQRDLSYFLLHDCLEKQAAKRIKKQIIELNADLKGEAIPLMDSFGVKAEDIVDVPIVGVSNFCNNE